MIPIGGQAATVAKLGLKTVDVVKGGSKLGKYSHIEDPANVGIGNDFTAAQKRNIIEENRKMNDGVVRSDQSGVKVVQPQKSQKGVTSSK